MTTVRYRSKLPASAETLFAFHADVRNLAQVSPPFPPFRLLSPAKPTEPGDEQRFRLGAGPLAITWVARVTRLERPHLLEDVQVRGPFRAWRHRHRFEADGEGAWLVDIVRFRFFPTPAGPFLDWLLVRPALGLLFRYRHRATARLLRESTL